MGLGEILLRWETPIYLLRLWFGAKCFQPLSGNNLVRLISTRVQIHYNSVESCVVYTLINLLGLAGDSGQAIIFIHWCKCVLYSNTEISVTFGLLLHPDSKGKEMGNLQYWHSTFYSDNSELCWNGNHVSHLELAPQLSRKDQRRNKIPSMCVCAPCHGIFLKIQTHVRQGTISKTRHEKKIFIQHHFLPDTLLKPSNKVVGNRHPQVEKF